MTHSGDYFRALVSGERRGVGPMIQRGGLRLLSWPYGWATRLRNGLFDRGWKRSFKAGVPVVSVGNLTLGGTGKTPFVEYVAGFYRRADLLVAILSRGYGNVAGRNDEALVLEENLPDVPHLQGVDRVELAATAALELESEVLVLDDGFQHRRLARDLDVVLIDATNPWGHGYLFPRGLLRESPRGLRRAGIVALTRCDQVERPEFSRIHERIRRFAPDVPVIETTHRPTELINQSRISLPLERLRDRPVAAFCGIGNPEAFRRTLADLGVNIGDFRAFSDHHPYNRADVENLMSWARRQATDCLIVTTQKDQVKLRVDRLGDKELYALRIQLHVEAGQDVLDQKLREVVKI